MARPAPSVAVVVPMHQLAEAFVVQRQREAIVCQPRSMKIRAKRAASGGQKLLRISPQAPAPAHAAGLAWGQRVFQDSVDRHADELRARGLKF